MPRQDNAVSYLCFAPDGEPHGDCQIKPFANDDISRDGESKIWIGYRNDLDASYNGGMTFNEVLAQARANLSQAMDAPSNSAKRAQFREAFPGFATKPTGDVLQQLRQRERAFRQATCPSDTCKTRAKELLQMEWISIKSSVTKTEVFLIGYIFRLRGREMIAICRNYSSSLYRFQRTDGSVSTDMFIRTVNSEPNPSTKAKPGGSRASSNKNLKPRRSSRLDKSDALDNEDVMDGSPSNGFSTTTPCATVGSPAQSSPVMSMGEPAQGPEERTDDNKQEVASALTFMGPLSTLEEYTGIIAQLCHTYGVIALKLPNIVAHVNTMEQAVREDNRLALCQSFAKIKTILVVAAAGVDPDFLDEEYEAMVSSVIDEFGVELLNSTEGVMFMKDMGKAMVTGQREYRGLAYASLRAYMTAYTG